MACKELGTMGGGKVTGELREGGTASDARMDAFQRCSNGSCKERWREEEGTLSHQ